MLSKILNGFGILTGVEVNMAKSAIIGINMDEDLIARMASSLGCEVGTWPMKYLGIPLGGNLFRASFWEPVLSKVSKRLGDGRGDCFRKGERLLS